MAGIFLKSNETGYVVSNSKDVIYGSNGTESVTIAQDGSSNDMEALVIDANVEQVTFAGDMSDYLSLQTGNILEVYDDTNDNDDDYAADDDTFNCVCFLRQRFPTYLPAV